MSSRRHTISTGRRAGGGTLDAARDWCGRLSGLLRCRRRGLWGSDVVDAGRADKVRFVLSNVY